MRIRTTKTSSGATAVQVVRSDRGRTVILHHVGSGHTPSDIRALQQKAADWLTAYSHQQSFFSRESSFDPLFSRYRHVGTRYTLCAETLGQIMERIGFLRLNDPLLTDLVLIRVVEPASKRQSVRLLSRYFGRNHHVTAVYKHLPLIAARKNAMETILVQFAQTHLGFTFSFVLYDVTTLYFESGTSDELRTCGFSKDNKGTQPQVVVGLLVNGDGFPLTFHVFSGRTFEGHTIIPVLTALVQRYAIRSLTVVADAAMLSEDNIVALETAGLSYIVGARLGYLSDAEVTAISTRLNQTDHATVRTTHAGRTIICEFSSSRYGKDKRETEKQIKKATDILAGKIPAKRHRFLTGSVTRYTLNQPLIDRTNRLWGIKGYVTNVKIPDAQVIARYHGLWHVERSFRMAKSDLLARPVYHVKAVSITAHLVICVMALAVGTYLELRSRKSLRTVLELLMSVPDARIVNITTGEETLWRAEMPEDTKRVLRDLSITY